MHRGNLDLHLGDRLIQMMAGQAILLAPRNREHFLFTRDGQTHHSWCAIDPRAVPLRLRSVFRKACQPAAFTSRMTALLNLGKQTNVDGSGNGALEHEYALGLGLALLCAFASSAGSDCNELGERCEPLSRCEAFVLQHYSEPLKLPDLARASGVSPQHLLKLFRERGKGTPKQFLYRKRLDAASDLLSNTGLSMSEIAERCGFANAFHFSRKFREHFGKSPRLWRAHAWGKDGSSDLMH